MQPWSTVEQSDQYQKLAPDEQQAAKQQYFTQVVSQKPEFQSLPDDEKQAAASQFMGNVPRETPEHDQSIKEMAQGELKGAQGVISTLSKGASELATGKSLQDRAIEATKQNIPDNTSRPFDANVQAARNPINQAARIGIQASAGIAGEQADMLTSPLNAGAMAAGPIVEGASKVIPALRNTIAKAALSPEFAQDAGDFKYGHDARRVMQSMPDVIGEDAPSTKAAIVNKTQETGQAIGQTIASSPKASNPIGLKDNDIVGHIDDKIGELNKADPIGNKRTVRALEAKKVALLNNFDAQGNVVSPVDFENMTPQQAFDYKQNKLGDIKYTGRQGVDESALNSSLQQSRANVTSKMNDAMPELKPLNQDYGDLKAANDAIDKVIFNGQKEGLGGLGIKDFLTAGLKNPVNRAKFAQFLYTMPKAQQDALFSSDKSIIPAIQEAFGMKNPDVTKNLGDADIIKSGELFGQPGVVKRPAPFAKTSQTEWPQGAKKSANQDIIDNKNTYNSGKINSKLTLGTAGATATAIDVNKANAMAKVPNDDVKRQLAEVENFGKTTGNYAHITPIVLKDLQQRSGFNKNVTFQQAMKDPKTYDSVVKGYWDLIGNKYGIPENQKYLWWRRPADYKKYGGNINNMPESNDKSVMQSRLRNHNVYENRRRK